MSEMRRRGHLGRPFLPQLRRTDSAERRRERVCRAVRSNGRARRSASSATARRSTGRNARPVRQRLQRRLAAGLQLRSIQARSRRERTSLRRLGSARVFLPRRRLDTLSRLVRQSPQARQGRRQGRVDRRDRRWGALGAHLPHRIDRRMTRHEKTRR